MKFGIIGQDGNGAISHSDNLFYSWEFDNSESIKSIATEPLLVILFISTYYAMYNYFTGINNFTLTRAKTIKERDKLKFNYISNAIGNDLSILLCIPIYLANSSKQYFTYCAMALLLAIMMNNLQEEGSTTFYLVTVIIFVLTLMYKKYKNLKNEY